MAAWEFRGVDRLGKLFVGATTDEPVVFARKKYRAGWRALSVFRGDDEVAAISYTDAGKRIWWAQTQLDGVS